ncbi:MAG: uroporphyrinogen decarboxylase [Chlamydiia bacterium]|nr:uroporphyrinogen decarboxylase [Chlamydiia bacterium]
MTNTLLLKALAGQNHHARPPVWLMRQAGRYMPQYRAIRERHDFLSMCRHPEVAAEVTLLPIQLLDVDAAILFADILLILDAMGRGLRFEEKKGPILERPLVHPSEIAQLPELDIPGQLGYVGDAIRILRKELKVPLLGFAGAPFTLASYLIEGGSSRELKQTKLWMWREPKAFHQLLDYLTEATIRYLKMQVEAGAQALQLFDSWAHVLAQRQFAQFCLPYHRRIVEAIQALDVPMILFCRGSSVFAPLMAQTQAAISLDWNCQLSSIRHHLGPHTVLQGNLDPYVLYAPLETIRKEVQTVLTEMAGDPAYIFNLGHGILPDMDLDAVRCLVDTVKSFSACTATART